MIHIYVTFTFFICPQILHATISVIIDEHVTNLHIQIQETYENCFWDEKHHTTDRQDKNT